MKIEITFRTLLLLALGMIPQTATASNQDPAPDPKPSDNAILPQAAQDIENICALLEMPALAMQKTNTPRVSVTTKGGAVLYNPYFLTNAAYWGGPWAPIGLLAREVGRLAAPQTNCLQGDGVEFTENQKADFVAGFVLGRMGASLEEALQAVEAATPPRANQSIRADQLPAVERGWQRGQSERLRVPG